MSERGVIHQRNTLVRESKIEMQLKTKTTTFSTRQEEQTLFPKHIRRAGLLDPRFGGFRGSKNRFNLFQDLEHMEHKNTFPPRK